jgi:hypothetical protein
MSSSRSVVWPPSLPAQHLCRAQNDTALSVPFHTGLSLLILYTAEGFANRPPPTRPAGSFTGACDIATSHPAQDPPRGRVGPPRRPPFAATFPAREAVTLGRNATGPISAVMHVLRRRRPDLRTSLFWTSLGGPDQGESSNIQHHSSQRTPAYTSDEIKGNASFGSK